MTFKTLTSTIVLSFLLAGSQTIAMDEGDKSTASKALPATPSGEGQREITEQDLLSASIRHQDLAGKIARAAGENATEEEIKEGEIAAQQLVEKAAEEKNESIPTNAKLTEATEEQKKAGGWWYTFVTGLLSSKKASVSVPSAAAVKSAIPIVTEEKADAPSVSVDAKIETSPVTEKQEETSSDSLAAVKPETPPVTEKKEAATPKTDNRPASGYSPMGFLFGNGGIFSWFRSSTPSQSETAKEQKTPVLETTTVTSPVTEADGGVIPGGTKTPPVTPEGSVAALEAAGQ